MRVYSASVNVVAVCKPGKWVIRAVSSGFVRPDRLIANILDYVGRIDTDLVWTGYQYEGLPWYIHSGVGALSEYRRRIPSGLYKFPVLEVNDSKFAREEERGDMTLGIPEYIKAIDESRRL